MPQFKFTDPYQPMAESPTKLLIQASLKFPLSFHFRCSMVIQYQALIYCSWLNFLLGSISVWNCEHKNRYWYSFPQYPSENTKIIYACSEKLPLSAWRKVPPPDSSIFPQCLLYSPVAAICHKSCMDQA